MSIKIERQYNRIKVNFVGTHESIIVTEDELTNVIAHYYALKEHKPKTCALCKKIERKAKK